MNRAEYVVVIDSEPTVREVVSQILVHAGYEVAARADFGSALDLIRSRQPDLVITNVFLRDGTGHDAILRLKQEFPGTAS